MRTIRTKWTGALALVMAIGIAAACSDGLSTGPLLSPGEANFSTAELKVVKTAVAAAKATKGQAIGLDGGTITIDGGHQIYFPAGALTASTNITMERVEGSNIILSMGPHGLTFPADKQPTITLDWSTAEAPDTTKMVVAYVDSLGVILTHFTSTIDTTNKKLHAKIPHFSRFAVAQ